MATDTGLVDITGGGIHHVQSAQIRATNHNPSVRLADSTACFVYDSLRTGGMATIVTVYETDEDSLVGLWQIGSAGNRALWLNSQRVSYDDFAIAYRSSTERGVVIHTMLYQFPETDSSYDGRDTLFLGHEGDNYGDKNICVLLCFPGQISHAYQRRLESALAVRYGALLHGPYISRLSDTLWDPLGGDSLYSYGVCGIGRDDSLSLHQTKSIIRNGIMSIEAASPLADLDYVMLGCDSSSTGLGGDVLVIDTVPYLAVARRWKLRAHTGGDSVSVRLAPGLPLPAEAMRMVVTGGGTDIMLTPDTAKAFTLTLADGQDCHVTLLADAAALTRSAERTEGGSHSGKTAGSAEWFASGMHDAAFTVSPNPTTGHFTASVSQSGSDIIRIQVVDATGRVVDRHTTAGKHTRYLYRGTLHAGGIYYVTVTSNGRQETFKLIVNK